MPDNIKTTIKFPASTNELLKAILVELRFLRNEISLLSGEDTLEDYAHPDRIKHSYQEALKQYPIRS